MSSYSTLLAGALLAITVLQYVAADTYMHNPPGSNNRNREQNGNRDNANRLFDSQNNGAGGYPWRGDPRLQGQADELTYYPGSILRVEWTQQHACGPDSNVACEQVLQYACEDTMPNLRDGYPTGDIADQDQAGYTQATFQSQGQNDDGTNQVPMPPDVDGASGQTFNDDANFGANAANLAQNLATFYAGGQVGNYIGAEFGLHEGYDYYSKFGIGTQRNQGLYTADRNLGGDSARYTRQNEAGTRNGFEIAEERDYYPYWNPTPWRDIAVLTDDLDRCNYYQSHSQNVESKFYCDMTTAAAGQLAPISELNCATAGGVWTEKAAWGTPAPDCVLHAITRDNHLGNVLNAGDDTPSTAYYNWKIPNDAAILGKKCVFRMRYNMSATNYDSHANYYEPPRPMVDSSMNCDPDQTGENGVAHCGNSINVAGSLPLYQDPYVEVFAGLPYMGLNINTNQIGRTFQDRSFVFGIGTSAATQSVDGVTCDRVFNLNVRGKRGNIVQSYPATEYDFVPDTLDLGETDCVDIQIHNSDFNENNVAGNGADGTDASNIVQIHNQGGNIPMSGTQQSMFKTQQLAQAFMMVGQNPGQCANIKADDNNDQDIDNCGKLNARAYKFSVGGPVTFNVGNHEAINIRNNDFSNRSHKLKINVSAGGQPTGPGAGNGSDSSSGASSNAAGDAATGGSPTFIIIAVAGVAVLAIGMFGYRKMSSSSSSASPYGANMSMPAFSQPAVAQPQPGFQGANRGYQPQGSFNSGSSPYNSGGQHPVNFNNSQGYSQQQQYGYSHNQV